MEDISKAPILKSIRQFVDVEKAEEQAILQAFKPIFYPRKSILLQKGSISRNEFFVVNGCLRMYIIDQSGTEHTLSLNIENWWCGDLKSFINKEPASYYIQALEDTQVLQINLSSWNQLLDKSPKVDRWFRIGFQNALIAQQSRIIQNISLSAEERYLEYLKKYPHILQRVPQKYVASYLGMSPEFFSILRKKMASH